VQLDLVGRHLLRHPRCECCIAKTPEALCVGVRVVCGLEKLLPVKHGEGRFDLAPLALEGKGCEL
jgi:hypothetical protein